MRLARNRLNIVILDACRNNPFRGFSRSASRGLARLDAPKGSYILFATAPGDVAADGAGQNSPFTLALAKHISAPGANFERIVKRVGRDVSKVTQDKQRPWLSSSVYEDFFPAGTDLTKGASPDGTTKLPQTTTTAAANTNSSHENREAAETFRDCSVCPQMVVLPAGRYQMGSRSTKNTDRTLRPLHDVQIKTPIAVSKFEITFDEWEACLAEDGCAGYKPRDEKWGRGNRPVIRVNWEDAITYVEWLKHKTGKKYRLLSEAEWEYAARAGSGTLFSTGDTVTTYQANFDGRRSYNNSPKGKYVAKTLEVGQFKPNAFGLHDMHGNTSEWLADCWHKTYEGAPSDGTSWTTPPRGDTCNRRLLRGGSWFSGARDIRSAARRGMPPHIRGHEIGLRIARDVE